MTEAFNQRPIPECIRSLGDINQLLLDENKPAEKDPKKYQKVLKAIWEICSMFYPHPSDNTIHLSVPSRRLVELGLVSNETGEKIKTMSTETEEEGKNDKNLITIERDNSGGYTLTEKYVDTEDQWTVDGGVLTLHQDHFVEEKTHLNQNPNGILDVWIETKKVKPYLHFQNKIWPCEETPQEAKEKYNRTKTTPKRLDTTIVLLVEALVPGYIKPIAAE